MTISYNWISEYIPLHIDHEKISNILTSIGLEVESMEHFESIKGGLEGLVVGEVKESVQHPGADKLKLTKVDTGNGELLQDRLRCTECCSRTKSNCGEDRNYHIPCKRGCPLL
jgi:phenylalanyl-tRNA synthetase beta chain